MTRTECRTQIRTIRALFILLLALGLAHSSVSAQCRCFFDRPLDVVLILDTSDSMEDVVDAMKSNAHHIVEALHRHVKSFRVGLITYGYDDPKLSPLTDKAGEIIGAIDRIRNFGNYEPIDQALQMALNQMKWRADARKVILLVGDEEPDNERRENGIELTYRYAGQCAERGIITYVVSATPNRKPIPEFEEIARRSKGQSHTLEGAALLPSALINLSLGYGLNAGPPGTDRAIDYGFGPLLVAKLDMGDGWNMDRGDVAALLAEAKETLREDFSWRLVKPDVPPDELSKASVLYLSAHGAVRFTDDLRGKIRNFVISGGFLLADDCCQDEDFDRSFRVELKTMFPGKELRPIPDDHRFYHAPRTISKDVPHELCGIHIGCRTAIIYSKIDLSCRWVHGPELCKRISDQDALDIGVNILHRIAFYNAGVAAGHALQVKAQKPRLVIGQIQFDGAWNPPLHVLSPIFPDVFGGADQAARRPVKLSDPNLFDCPILYLTGHGAIRLPDQEIDRLRQYLKRGGFLFAEACCGDIEFDRSFRELIERVSPGGLHVLSPDHPVFSIAKKIADVTYAPSGERGPAFLEGVVIDDRTAVIYSKYDLAAAFLDHPAFSFRSVSKDDAHSLLSNIFLYALSY